MQKQLKAIFLGGSFAQIPILRVAKNRGWHIVVCDYLEDNPGQQLADEYYNISTTDYDAVLELSKKLNPDFIIAYASDPAAPIAAYVSEQLGLPTNSYESVRILSEKNLFRQLMIANGLNCPKILSFTEEEMDQKAIENLEFPVIVKPTDSSGSKGVTRVDSLKVIKPAIKYALKFSRNKRVIVEEFIDNDIADIHGDGFVIDGKLVFSCLGDHIYNGKVNPFNPTGTFWPSKLPKSEIEKIETDVARIIELSGFNNGPINIEARINHKGIPYVMEIGPRNGGHFVPQAIQLATGFNMLSASFNLMENKEIIIDDYKTTPTAYIALHSDEDGTLKEIEITNQFKTYIKEFHQYVQVGEEVVSFKGANAAIGILLLKFNTIEEMDYYIDNIDKYVKVKVDRSVV